MPELPEVETIRRQLEERLPGKKIVRVWVGKKKIVQRGKGGFFRAVRGKKITGIKRRGKLLFFGLSSGKVVLVHLKMTGQLAYRGKEGLVSGGHRDEGQETVPNKYTHLWLEFSDGTKLFYNDLRQFGYWRAVSREEAKRVWNSYGAELLEIGLRDWRKLLRGKRRILKALLLDQKVISGIGNIYADEICFSARVRPDRRVETLSDEEVKKIFYGGKRILKEAIELGGTSFSTYRDLLFKNGGYGKKLRVYKKEGERCGRCKRGVIKKTVVAGRGTRFCPRCQV